MAIGKNPVQVNEAAGFVVNRILIPMINEAAFIKMEGVSESAGIDLSLIHIFTMAFVKTEVQGAVEIITIDRPKALNALNPEVLADLKACLSLIHISPCWISTGACRRSGAAPTMSATC